MGTFVTGNTPLPAPKTDASPPQGLPTELDAADINNINSALGDLREHGRGWLNVRDFGTTGTADDTAVLQAAISAAQAAGLRLYVPSGTYTVTGLTISASMRLSGGGTLKLKNATATDLLTITGTSTVVRISGLTFDGNEQNQASEAPNRTINFLAIGTATAPAGLDVNHCTFVNGCHSDIRVSTDGTTATVEWVRIASNTFLGGREGTSLAYDPRYINLASPTDYVVEGNIFDRLAGPTVYGRAGVVAFDGFGTFVEGRGAIVGNTFVQTGRSQATSSIGSIDLYSRARSVVISGNSITNPYGRGINVKAESRAVAITGNTVSGMAAGSDGTIGAQITMNASSTSSEANGPFTISGNSIMDGGQDGINISARDVGGAAWAHGVLVSNNTITNAGRRAIGISMGAEVSVVDNNINGGVVGVFADAVTTAMHITGNMVRSTTSNAIHVSNVNPGCYLNIANNTAIGGARAIFIASGAGGVVSGNVCTGQVTSAIDISGTTAALRVSSNFSDDAIPFVNSGTNTALHLFGNDWTMNATAHTLTMAAGVITATMDWHYVETAGGIGSDNLTTINGGFDGYVLTLRPATTGHVVIVQDSAGNMKLNGDFAMDNVQDSITLRWCNDFWIEMSRSDNVTVPFSGNITGNGQTFTPSVKSGSTLNVVNVTGAFTYIIGATIGAPSDRLLSVRVKNTSAGAIGPGTWNAVYKMAAWTEPAAGQSRVITFQFDGTNWVEHSRTADVPN